MVIFSDWSRHRGFAPLDCVAVDEHLAMMTRLYAMMAGALALLAALFGVRHSGAKAERERQEAMRQAEHAESLGRRNDTLRKSREQTDAVDRMSDDDVARRLRDQWSRSDR